MNDNLATGFPMAVDLCTLTQDNGTMLDQATVDRLLALEKAFTESDAIVFPAAGQATELEVISVEGREAFLIGVNRRGKIKVSKCTYKKDTR
jgi:hypothetical protein